VQYAYVNIKYFDGGTVLFPISRMYMHSFRQFFFDALTQTARDGLYSHSIQPMLAWTPACRSNASVRTFGFNLSLRAVLELYAIANDSEGTHST
jgi:hypothetical protein